MAENCGCSCDESVTALIGATGSDGTSEVIATASLSTTAAVHYMYTANRLDTASNNVYAAGAGYEWSLITIPAVAASNIAIFDLTAQINATDVHTVTVTVLNTNSGAPVANISAIQACGLRESLAMRFQIGNVVQGDVFAVKILSDGAAVTPVLTSGNCQIDIYN